MEGIIINELNKLSKSAFNKLSDKLMKYLEIKEDLFDNGLVEVVGDVFKVIDIARKTSGYFTQKKFEWFLKGLSETDVPTEESINKLAKYIDDEAKAEFIADTFTKVLLANSTRSCLVMGSILKTMEQKGSDITHEDLLCISALQNMYDVDIKNFIIISDYLIGQPTNMRKRKNFTVYQLRSYFRNELNLSSIQLTIEKLVSSQILRITYEVEPDIDFDTQTMWSSEADEEYSITRAGEILQKYIKRIEAHL